MIDNEEWNGVIDFAIDNRDDFSEGDARDFFWEVANSDDVIPVEDVHEALVEEAEYGDNWVVNTLVWAIEDGYDGEDYEDCDEWGWCYYEWGYCDDLGACYDWDTGMPVGEDGHDIEEFEECFDNGWCNYEWGYCDDQGECLSSDTGMIVDRNGMPVGEDGHNN